MTGKNHLIFGGLCGGLVLYHEYVGGVPIVPTAVAVGTCVLGNLLPDIDVPTSVIGKLLKPFSILFQKIFGHRTFFHSLLALAFLYVGMWYWSMQTGSPHISYYNSKSSCHNVGASCLHGPIPHSYM